MVQGEELTKLVTALSIDMDEPAVQGTPDRHRCYTSTLESNNLLATAPSISQTCFPTNPPPANLKTSHSAQRKP